MSLEGPAVPRNRTMDATPASSAFDREDDRPRAFAGRSNADASRPAAVLRLKLLGASQKAIAEGEGASLATSNYFIGNDPAKWRTGVPTYASVKYRDVYQGTDLVYYGNQGQLESDFIVAPGADASRIKFRIEGAKHLAIDSQGNMAMTLGAGQVQLRRPLIYQETAGRKREIAGGYRLNAKNEVSFWVGAYDAAKALVIDPVLVYSTYLGGSGDDNFIGTFFGGSAAGGVATDSSGNVYVVGMTVSTDFPTLHPAYLTCASCPSLNPDVFVAKYSSTGTLVYSTYLGGSSYNFPGGSNGSGGIAVDAVGDAYITGTTGSPDFPVTTGAYQTKCGTDGTCNGGAGNAFITALNPSGSGLVYSTFLGGSCGEDGNDIAVDSLRIAYVTGDSCSPEFPVTAGALQSPCVGGPGACMHVFVTLFNPSGSALVYSALFGGSGGDLGYRIRTDSSGAAYVAGATSSPDFPTVPSGGLPGSGLSGGAFVTTNGGVTWNATNSGLPHNAVTALAVDPGTAGTVYAGTPNDGLFKSANFGTTWSPIDNGIPVGPNQVSALATGGGRVYAAVLGPGGGVFWSQDSGNTWSQSALLAQNGPPVAVVVDPTTPLTVYAAMRRGQVQKSTDGGQTFSTASVIPPPYGPPNCNFGISSLIVDPQNPAVLYLSTRGCGIFQSRDGALTWNAVNNGFGSLFNQAVLQFLPLAIDPSTNPSTVYAGVFWNVWKSSDAGANWTLTPANFGPGGVARVTTIALDSSSSPTTIYVGLAADGARKSTDGGNTWSNVSAGLDLDIQAMVLSPSTPAVLYAGTVLREKGFVAKVDPSGTSLNYSTYLGGNGNDGMYALAVDSVGDAYVSGRTTSTNFPVTAGAFQTVNHGNADAFVTKLNRTGTGLIYSTYVGGSGISIGLGVATDVSGVAYVAGFAYSNDFPTVNPPLFPTPGLLSCGVAPLTHLCGHGILFQVNPTGTALVSSTYFGGSKDDYGNDLAMDATPSVSITGSASSMDFPILNAAQPTYAGGNADAFVTKIDFSNSTQTPPGTNVPVQPSDSATGTKPAVVTFSNVTAAGNTTVGTSSNAPTSTLPANFQLGNPPTFYNISTSATFTGSVNICISYADVNYTDPTQLHLFHLAGSTWVNVTTSLNTSTQTICGSVTSFSPFAILQRTTTSPPMANPGMARTVGCAGPTGASVTLNGSASTDPNGETLTYAWSGRFGTATGVSPTVLLPLGASTVTLVVRDPFLSSPPVTVSITVAVGVQGLGSPLAALVPSGQQVPFPDHAFQLGRTLPLKLDLVCGSTPLAGSNVTAPRIVALERNGDALNLQTIDPPDASQEDSSWIFRSAGNDWVYNLRTKDLSSGTYTITIQMPDASKYDAGFVLR